jgi:hypothetical protein
MKIKKNKKNIPLENKNESPRISSAGRNEAVLNTDKVPKNVEGAQHIKDEPAPRKEAVVPVVPEVPEKKPKVAPSTQKNDSGEPASKKEYETKKENDVLKEKIKEQKRILRKKIETARRNAYVTRKPTEIEKTEKIIKDILDKYGLTEETLNEDS